MSDEATPKPKRASRAKKAVATDVQSAEAKVEKVAKAVKTKFVKLFHNGNDLVVPDLSNTANMPLRHGDVVEVPADFDHPLFQDDPGPATNVRDNSVPAPVEVDDPGTGDQVNLDTVQATADPATAE